MTATLHVLYPRTPTESPQIHEAANAPQVRRLDCTHYNACLNDALAQKRGGFTCVTCRAHTPIDREQMRQDMYGMAAMLEAIPDEPEAEKQTAREKANRAYSRDYQKAHERWRKTWDARRGTR